MFSLLKFLSKLILWRYKPIIIGVVGDIGKTSAKEAIYTVLKSKFTVRRNQANDKKSIFSAILGTSNKNKNFFSWLGIIFLSIFKILIKIKHPQVLILEMNASPSNIKYFTKFIPFHIGLVTAIGEIPSRGEFFAGEEKKAKEKINLLKSLHSQDFAILNYDDATVFDMKSDAKAYIITFGFGGGAEVRAINYEILNYPEQKGITFKIDFEGNIVPVRVFNTFGKSQVYAALAATAVGVTLDLNLIEISQSLEKYQSPPGRMKLIKGIKESLIIDDSYDASSFSMLTALEVLKEIKGKRKVAVLGDIIGIGKYTEQAHRHMGEEAAKIVDLLFVIGPRAKFIADEAKIKGFLEEKIFQFEDLKEAGLTLQKKINKEDLILVKGSREIHLEKIVEEIMAYPEKANELLLKDNN